MKPNVFAFTHTNFLLLAVGMALVVVGLILMSGSGSDLSHFEESIFDSRHIKTAPLVCLAGYLFIVVAILFRRKPAGAKKSAVE